MNKARLLMMVAVIVPLLLLLAYVAISDFAPVTGTTSVHYSSFVVEGKRYGLTYIATNETGLQRGLMNTKVTGNTTMLFVFPTQGYYSFWMFGVNSSLDIIWISAPSGSSVGKVVYLEAQVPPCNASISCTFYHPSVQANMVIEAKGGFAAANGVEVGTAVSFN